MATHTAVYWIKHRPALVSGTHGRGGAAAPPGPAVDGSYFGSRYFGARYFGKRYFN